MRKVWTRIATFALILVVTISFSACSLFTVNLDKKYSADIMVKTAANDDLSVSRRELYYGYLEWGYQYAQYYDSTEKLLDYIADALLNNKILEKISVERFGAIREVEEALALKRAYQSLDSSIRSAVYEALNLEDKQDTDNQTDEDQTETADVDQPYKPSILVGYENGERIYTMDLSSYADEDGNGMLSLKDYQYYVPATIGVASTKNIRDAISQIVRNLKSLESGFTKLQAPERDYLMPENDYFRYLSQDDRAVLNREIDRMVNSNKTSILGERISTAYNLGFTDLSGNDAVVAWDAYLNRGRNFADWCDAVNANRETAGNVPAYYGCGRIVATNIAEKAINYYKSNVGNAIKQQQLFPDSSLESTLMSSGLADVYYIPQDVANNLFTVSHILIGFTDEQKDTVKQIQEEAEQNPSYQNNLDSIYAETQSNGVSAYDVLIELQTALDKADNLQEKYQIFREFINKYNTDPGMQNLEQLDSNSKPKTEYLMSSNKDNNTMVESFTEASLALFDEGIKGEISGLVWSEYGAHIIMYTRDVSDFIFTGVKGLEQSSISLLETDYADTLFATLTSYGKRTLFDTIVDAYYYPRDYSAYRTSKINEYRNQHAITTYDNELKKFF